MIRQIRHLLSESRSVYFLLTFKSFMKRASAQKKLRNRVESLYGVPA